MQADRGFRRFMAALPRDGSLRLSSDDYSRERCATAAAGPDAAGIPVTDFEPLDTLQYVAK
jgi:hypothetical protein